MTPAAIRVAGADSVDLDALATVYAAAFAGPPHREPDAAGLRDRLPRHRLREGFSLAVATLDGDVIGFAYGVPGRAQDWAGQVPEGTDDFFELVELAVLPASQGRGVGTALLAAVLDDRPEARVLLRTHDGDTPAMRIYRRAGFRRLAPIPLGVAMAKELR